MSLSSNSYGYGIPEYVSLGSLPGPGKDNAGPCVMFDHGPVAPHPEDRMLVSPPKPPLDPTSDPGLCGKDPETLTPAPWTQQGLTWFGNEPGGQKRPIYLLQGEGIPETLWAWSPGSNPQCGKKLFPNMDRLDIVATPPAAVAPTGDVATRNVNGRPVAVTVEHVNVSGGTAWRFRTLKPEHNNGTLVGFSTENVHDLPVPGSALTVTGLAVIEGKSDDKDRLWVFASCVSESTPACGVVCTTPFVDPHLVCTPMGEGEGNQQWGGATTWVKPPPI